VKNLDHIEHILHHHLSNKAGKTILLSGPWGCGKTFLWRTKIAPQFAAEKPITLSLFGVESLSAFKISLMNASLIRRASLLGEKKFKEAAKNFMSLIGAGFRKGADLFIGADFFSSQIDPVNLIDDGLIICFDDLERRHCWQRQRAPVSF
jgi:DNA polymerase III delta prime subunit